MFHPTHPNPAPLAPCELILPPKKPIRQLPTLAPCAVQAAGTAGKQIRVAVCSGVGNAVELLKQMKAGEAHYDFVEVGEG